MKKKILSIALVVCIAITAIAGATLAYLKDTDSDVNTFTVGNVKIEQYEKDRNGADFKDQKLYPIVNDSKDANGYHMGANYVDKIVTVKNTGTENAYIRTHMAIPAALDDGPETFDASANILHWNGASANDTFGAANWGGDIENDWYWGTSTKVDWPGENDEWNFYQANINGILYNVYVATHGKIVEPNQTTAPSLFGVYLDKDVNYDHEKINAETGATGYFLDRDPAVDIKYDLSQDIDILIVSEAVQSQGWDNAFDALDQAFGAIGDYTPFEGGTVVTNN